MPAARSGDVSAAAVSRLPPAASPPPPPAVPAPSSADDAAAAVVTFMRDITPSLRNIDAVAAAVLRSRLTMCDLASATADGATAQEWLAGTYLIADSLGISDGDDRLHLLQALRALARGPH